MKNICCDVILVHDFLQHHFFIGISFSITFGNLTAERKPVTVKLRRYSLEEKEFIKSEVAGMLSEGILKTSEFSWRPQILKTSSENHKKKLVINYSQTMNRFIQLSAYSLPRIDEMINKIAKSQVYSTPDIKSAYHHQKTGTAQLLR